MAKRFTDTSKWDKAAFMSLPAKLKLAWAYLCDKCDHAGIWDINISLMNVHIGEHYSLDELVQGLGSRVQVLSLSKLLLSEFVEFQYGELNSSNKVHLSVLNRLKKEGAYKPLPSPYLAPCDFSQGTKDKEKEKDTYTDKDTDKEKDKEKEESCQKYVAQPQIKVPIPPPDNTLAQQIESLVEIYRETLRHFGQRRTLLETEKLAIGRAIQQYKSAKGVELALIGARYEPRSEKFNPADWVDLNRYLDPKNFKRFMGYGVKRVHVSEEKRI